MFKFEVFENMRNIKDSMQLDSGTEICRLVTDHDTVEIRVKEVKIMTLQECVKTKFELVDKEDIKEVVGWLENALGISSNAEISDELSEVICDRHWEDNEEDMFDWIHDGDESPTEIHQASWVTELDNVLVLKTGCYFWYEVNN